MEIITIEAKAYRELVAKIDQIHGYVRKDAADKKLLEGYYVVNNTLAEILGISERTIQRMRSKDIISYSIWNKQCYYAYADIVAAINKNRVRIKPTRMSEIYENFKLKSIKL